MTHKIYLRPIGTLWGEDACDPSILKVGYVGFSHVEMIERQCLSKNQFNTEQKSQIKKTKLPYAHIAQSKDTYIREILRKIKEPRPSIRNLDFAKPNIMGIINVTEDSFSDGGKYHNTQKAVDHARKLVKQGADIIDIGGESTRPGASAISSREEMKRVIPVFEKLKNDHIILSCDTRKSNVMEEAIKKGAHIINDVSALSYDPKSIKVIKKENMPVILMHARGDPKTMQHNPQYDNVLLDVYDQLENHMNTCLKKGINIRNIIIDPGIGFGKTFEHNLKLIHGISIFHGLGVPVMLGASRKKFIGEINKQKNPHKRILGSVAVALIGFNQGVQIARVHDVKQTYQATKTWLQTHRQYI